MEDLEGEIWELWYLIIEEELNIFFLMDCLFLVFECKFYILLDFNCFVILCFYFVVVDIVSIGIIVK